MLILSELTALYQDRKSTCYWSSGQKMVISSKSAHTRSILTLTAWTSSMMMVSHTLLRNQSTFQKGQSLPFPLVAGRSNGCFYMVHLPQQVILMLRVARPANQRALDQALTAGWEHSMLVSVGMIDQIDR